MEKNTSQKLAVLLTGIALSFTACTTDVYEPKPDPTPNPVPDGKIFDFSMESSYTLNVKYVVPQGYKVMFEVYTEDPVEIDVTGTQVKKKGLSPIDVGYTDENGNYNYSTRIPAGVKDLYLYTSYAGVPRVMVCHVENGSLSTPEPYYRMSEGVTKASSKSNLRSTKNTVLFPIQTNILGSWEYDSQTGNYGRPNYINGTKISIPAEVLKSINAALPGDNEIGRETDARVLQAGDIQVSKDAKLSLHIIGQECAYFNALAYYCYDTNNPPTSKDNIKIQTLALPCALINGLDGSGRSFALSAGEGIDLKYCDAKGDLKDEFPAGTSVGWILYSDGFMTSYSKAPITYPYLPNSGDIHSGYGPLYSNNKLNDGQLTYTALFRHGDFVVTTFEDTKKNSESDRKDYRDLMFHVASTPADAITPGVPDVDPDPVPPTPTTVSKNGTLAFEDLWPRQGDFDMNDVVVKYLSEATYTGGQLELVSEVNIEYQLLWSGASIRNGFAVQFPEGAAVTVNGTLVALDDSRAVVLFEDALALASSQPKASVKVKFNTPISKNEAKKLAPFNPYIFADKREVHLTGYMPTSKMDKKLLGTADDRSNPDKNFWYITFVGEDNNQQLPFAIDVPFDGKTEYVICPESKRIDTVYPTFINWINTQGEKDADWYLNPKK